MARYGFPGATKDLGALVKRLSDWLQQRGYETTVVDHGTRQRISAKKSSGLRDLAGMSSAITVECAVFDAEDITVCEITRLAVQDSLAKAAAIGFFTGGATWVTAGVAANQVKALEEEAVSQLETWLSCQRLSAATTLPSSNPDGDLTTTQDNNDDIAKNLATAAEVSGKAVTIAASLASGFLRGTGEAVKAMGKAIGAAFSYKCPKCKESEYDKKEIHLHHQEEVRTAYRLADGTLRKNLPLSNVPYVQVQAVYSVFTHTWELKCRKCGNVWNEKSEERYIK